MVLHRRADDVRHLVVASVVELAHRVQDAPLHRLQSVVDVRHGTFQNHIRSIVKKPSLYMPVSFRRSAPLPVSRPNFGRTARLGCFRNGLRLARSRSLRPAVVRRSALRDGSLPEHARRHRPRRAPAIRGPTGFADSSFSLSLSLMFVVCSWKSSNQILDIVGLDAQVADDEALPLRAVLAHVELQQSRGSGRPWSSAPCPAASPRR